METLVTSTIHTVNSNKPMSLPTETQQTQQTNSWDDIFKQLEEPIQPTEITKHYISNKFRQDNLEDMPVLTPDRRKDNINYTTMEPVINVSSTRITGCYECGGQVLVNGNLLICQSCGVEMQGMSGATDETYSAVAPTDCSVNEKGFMSMKIIGKGAYGYNRSLLKSCANYNQYRKMNTLKEMHGWNAQNLDKQLPKNVIEEANNMIAKIKEHGHVFRKDVKKGIQSSCIYYACYNNGISRTPSELAQFVGIAEKFHSSGDRYLRDLNERGIIELPDKVDPIVDYVERYMELLGIDKKYKDFVLDIITVADREKLHVLCDSKNNTKAIGAIYLLIDRVPELRKSIPKERIDKECEISKTTFVKYYSLLCKYYRKFVPIFVKHQIPMKPEWKENIEEVIDNSKNGIDTDVVVVKKVRANKKITKKKLNTDVPIKRRVMRQIQTEPLDKIVEDALLQPVESKKTIIRPKSASSMPLRKLKLRV